MAYHIEEPEMQRKYFILSSLSLLLSYSPLFASEHKEAKELFTEAKCMRCHSTNDFKAQKDRVNSFKKLNISVEACASNTHAGWFEEDIHNVSRYLNHKYYDFKQPPKLEE